MLQRVLLAIVLSSQSDSEDGEKSGKNDKGSKKKKAPKDKEEESKVRLTVRSEQIGFSC